MQTIIHQLNKTHNNLRSRYPVNLMAVNSEFKGLNNLCLELNRIGNENMVKGFTRKIHQDCLIEAVDIYIKRMVAFENNIIRSARPERILMLTDTELSAITSVEDFWAAMRFFKTDEPVTTYIGTRRNLITLYHPSGLLCLNWQFSEEGQKDDTAWHLRTILSQF